MSVFTFILASVTQWDNIMSVNARGVFLCYKYAAQAMIARGKGGRIIGAASLAGKQGKATSLNTPANGLNTCLLYLGVVYAPAYSASKFAVRGLTQCAGERSSYSPIRL